MGGSTTVQAPAPIDPAKVGADSLATQLQLAPQVYAGEAQYRPQYAKLDQQILADSLLGGNGAPGLLDLYGTAATQLGNQQVAANTQQRTADIADVNALGGQARAAYEAANPALARTMSALGDNISAQRNAGTMQATPDWAGAGNLGPTAMAGVNPLGNAAQMQTSFARAGRLGPAQQMQSFNAQAGNLGPTAMANAGPLGNARGYDAATLSATGVADSALTPGLVQNAQNFAAKTPLQTMLEQQAQDSLLSGGNLTASELSKAQQDVRGAYAARGLNDSNGSIGAEILNTDAARQAKMSAARTFASGVDAAGQATLNANRSFATGVEDSLMNRGQFNAGAANNAAAINTGAVNQARATNAGAENQFQLSQFNTNADLARTNAGAQNTANQLQYSTQADLAARNAAAQTAASGTNAGAANQFALTQYGQQGQVSLANAAAQNQTSATNAGAQNQFQLSQFGTNADLARTNAGALNTANQLQYSTNADLSRSNSALSLQSQLANMDYSRASTNDQFAREFQLAQMQQSQAQDPFQMVLGRSAAPAAAQSATANAGYTQNSGAKLFDPFNNSLMQIYAGNNANQLAASTATANNSASMIGAGIGAAGMIGGGLLVF